MKPLVRYGLLLGAIVIAGGGVAVATLTRSHSSGGTIAAAADYSSSASYRRGRTGGKFFTQYDLDHDGRVTREEFNTALAQQFSQASDGAENMTQAQYVDWRLKDLRTKTDQMFHRDDWNGDGKLTLDEYAQPERARFEAADRNGTGNIACGRTSTWRVQSDDATSLTSTRSNGRAVFCRYDDLNQDGQVTRAEFDQATAKEFASQAKGGLLAPDQFYAIIAGHVHDSAVRNFVRLNVSRDGELDEAEFAASELRYFARLDRNNDGVVTREETGQRRTSALTNDKPGPT